MGIVSGRNTPDKMEKAGWTVEKAPNVNAPVFKEFPMTLECRVKQKIDESETGYYLVAEIVNILCDEKYLAEDGKPDVEKMKLITFDPVHHLIFLRHKNTKNLPYPIEHGRIFEINYNFCLFNSQPNGFTSCLWPQRFSVSGDEPRCGCRALCRLRGSCLRGCSLRCLPSSCPHGCGCPAICG